MAVQFGLVRETGTYGICQNVETDSSVEENTYNDANGDVAAVNTRDLKEAISLEYVYDSSLTPPTAGNSMTINAHIYKVQSVKETEVTDDYRKVSITGMRWVTNTIPAS